MGQKLNYSNGEELANAISHFAGFLFAVAGLVLMVHYSVKNGTDYHLVSTSVFGISMIMLYLSSALAHILPAGKVKNRFFTMDRIAIYLLIAGTYTPVALIILNGPLGWIIFGIEWGMAIVGTLMILTRPGESENGVHIFYVLSYACMGWLILIAVVPVIRTLSPWGSLWILIGGLCYTVGILFYKFIRFPYHHLVWHILVLAGTVSHFFAVFFYMIPR